VSPESPPPADLEAAGQAPARPTPSPHLAPWLSTRGAHLALLVLATGLVYASGRSAPFVHDDYGSILHNPVIFDPSLLVETDRLDAQPLDPDLRNSIRARTFSYLTFALNARVAGFDPISFRAVNVAIHAINACLVYLLVAGLLAAARRGTSADPDPPAPARTSGLALVVALLFAVHPISTNAVTYITQRFTSLVALLYLGALAAYVAARAARSRRSAAAYLVVSLGATALAMDTKETAFTIPLALTLVEVLFFVAPRARRALLLAPFYATMIIIPATILTSVPAESALPGRLLQATDLMNLDHISRSSYLFTQFRVIVTYLRLLLLPTGLNFDRDYPVFHDLLAPPVLASLVALAALFAGGLVLLARARRRQDDVGAHLRLGGFGLLFFFLALAMSSSVIPINDVINEYRAYLPSVGFFLALVATGEALLLSRAPDRPWLARRAVAVGCAIWIGALGVSTIARNSLWSDGLAFAQDTWRKSPAKIRVAEVLANQYLARGMGKAALATLYELARLNPTLGKPHLLLGMTHLRLGRTNDAVAELERARAIRSDRAEIHLGLVQAYTAQGRPDLASRAYEEAVRLDPKAAAAALAPQGGPVMPPHGPRP